jgi:hypothetical protein
MEAKKDSTIIVRNILNGTQEGVDVNNLEID